MGDEYLRTVGSGTSVRGVNGYLWEMNSVIFKCKSSEELDRDWKRQVEGYYEE